MLLKRKSNNDWATDVAFDFELDFELELPKEKKGINEVFQVIVEVLIYLANYELSKTSFRPARIR